MAIESRTALSSEAIAKIQNLIQINIDSEKGLQEAASQIEDMHVAELFRELSMRRSQNAAELQDLIEWNGETAKNEGTYLAAFQRAWMDLRAQLSQGDAYVILSQAERSEDTIKHAYEDALKENLGDSVHSLLMQQFRNVKSGHDRVRNLRDEYANP